MDLKFGTHIHVNVKVRGHGVGSLEGQIYFGARCVNAGVFSLTLQFVIGAYVHNVVCNLERFMQNGKQKSKCCRGFSRKIK